MPVARSPRSLAGAAVFLASSDAGAMTGAPTGTALNLSGGSLAD